MITEERKAQILKCWKDETDDFSWREDLTGEEVVLVGCWDDCYDNGRRIAGEILKIEERRKTN